MKKKIFLALKSAAITVFILSFLILTLKIMNVGRRKIYGREVFVYFKYNTVYLKDGKTKYSIEPDKTRLQEVINYIYQHPGILPFPFNFMVYGSSLVASFFEKEKGDML